MKKKILAVIMAATMLANANVTLNAKGNTYPETGMVYQVKHINFGSHKGEDKVYIICQNGNKFCFRSDAGDWNMHDIASCIMDSKGTAKVSDDAVLDAKYSGWETNPERWVKKCSTIKAS